MKRLFPILSVLFLTACSSATPTTPTPIVITAVTTPTAIPATATVAAAPSYPAPTQINIAAVYEPFERGFMIYLSDRKQIWVFIRPALANTTTNLPVNFGQWLAYADTF
ncbi:MAG: hypothetical protein HZB77_13215, partial [Chloroflexi bacterium]|nr:hypothetical protein [Chloroflexota bacterium]